MRTTLLSALILIYVAISDLTGCVMDTYRAHFPGSKDPRK